MPHEEYLKAARKLLRGITKKDLLTAENRKRIIDMVNAEELELWEINDEITENYITFLREWQSA